MKHPIRCILGAALLATGPAALAASQATAEARVIGGPPDPAQYLYEVELTAINGERIIPRDMLTLEPGTYTLTARIPAEYTEPAIGQRKRLRSEDVDFEITLEPGEDYSVRVKWNRASLEKPYELVVDTYDCTAAKRLPPPPTRPSGSAGAGDTGRSTRSGPSGSTRDSQPGIMRLLTVSHWRTTC